MPSFMYLSKDLGLSRKHFSGVASYKAAYAYRAGFKPGPRV